MDAASYATLSGAFGSGRETGLRQGRREVEWRRRGFPFCKRMPSDPRGDKTPATPGYPGIRNVPARNLRPVSERPMRYKDTLGLGLDWRRARPERGHGYLPEPVYIPDEVLKPILRETDKRYERGSRYPIGVDWKEASGKEVGISTHTPRRLRCERCLDTFAPNRSWFSKHSCQECSITACDRCKVGDTCKDCAHDFD